MRILFVDTQLPMPDRASADVRMLAMVQLLREQGHDCHYYVSDIAALKARLGEPTVAKYQKALSALGVHTIEGRSFEPVLAATAFDVVFFKYFYSAEKRIPLVRIWQPWARVVVDSVDLVYVRLGAKAKVSGSPLDRLEAEHVMVRELATYAAADLVITVTEDEAGVLKKELPDTPIHVIPNIHEIPNKPRSETPDPSLLFIGTFSHEPNVDGIIWFIREIWPTILAVHPEARVRIVGSNPPPAIQSLDGNGITTMGYVPETLPLLMESWVSIAPLRFGAGMKGKVGEAMAVGLPVVTTTFGAEGFGLTPGKHLLVADSPRDYAEAVSRLIATPGLRWSVGQAGRDFIESHYSPGAVARNIKTLAEALVDIRPQRDPLRYLMRILRRFLLWTERHLIWRLRRNAA